MSKHFVKDQTSLENMILVNYQKIYSFIYRKSFDKELSKDLTQETFLHFVENLDKYTEQGQLLNYLYRIALNLYYDHSKKKSEELYEEIERYTHDNQNDGKKIFDHKQRKLILREWINKLPEHLQDVILLRYDEGLKFKDIEKITGVNSSTLKSQVKVALNLLRKYAKEDQYE